MMEMIMPGHPLLCRYISYIYRFSATDPQFSRQLVLFPNVGAAITIIKDLVFQPGENSSFLSRERPGESNVILHLNRAERVTIKEEGRQYRIGIVFTPLGINQFIRQHPGDLLEKYDPSLIPLAALDHSFRKFCITLYKERPLSEIAKEIETLLLALYVPFTNDVLENCIREFSLPLGLKNIQQLAGKLGASPKTMNRLFRKYTGLTPVAFRRIMQFRNAIQAKMQTTATSFGQVAFDNDYCDTSYMTNVFRDLADSSTRDFFKHISSSGNSRYLYKESAG